MAEKSVVVIGLPESGKTTYLAAFWHLLNEGEVDSKLKFANLKSGNLDHLNKIADLWRQAKKQERTSTTGDRMVSIQVRREDERIESIIFPDVAGEAFRQMWEDRSCEESISKLLVSGGIMLFIHADTIKAPGWIVDDKTQCEAMGIEYDPGKYMSWEPRLAPTQVQIVDLLQTLQTLATDKEDDRRLAIILSAWDTVEAERLSPSAFLTSSMPLLAQYLKNGLSKDWVVRIYGVSAQGGEYDKKEERSEAAERLREMDAPSARIKVVTEDITSNDLTAPLDWLLR